MIRHISQVDTVMTKTERVVSGKIVDSFSNCEVISRVIPMRIITPVTYSIKLHQLTSGISGLRRHIVNSLIWAG